MGAIDVDQHIHEPRAMWRDYADPDAREDAIALEDDDLGYTWLTWRGAKLYLADVQFPGKSKRIGNERLRLERGDRSEYRYDETLPAAYTDAKARVAQLDEFGLDSSVVFPNFGLLWEGMLSGDLRALTSNMRAHNRWMADVVSDGGGRLHGVAHVTLRDPAWLTDELAVLERAGIRLAMVAPGLVDGQPPSHADLDPIWRAFCEHNIAPVFHVGGFEKPFAREWDAGDPEPVDKIIDSLFLWVPPALALANMVIGGTFERFPELRVGVVELTAHWVPQFMMMLEGVWGFYTSRHGKPMRELSLNPSEYIRRQVRVAVLAYEQPVHLIELVGEDMFMFGSDWPHSEGIADPLGMYEKCVEGLAGTPRAKLFEGNARWLLGG